MRPFKFVIPLFLLYLLSATPTYASFLVPTFTHVIVQFFLVSVGIFFLLTLPFKQAFKRFKYHDLIINFIFASLPAYLITLFFIRSALGSTQSNGDPLSFILPILAPFMLLCLLLIFLPLVIFDYLISKTGKSSAFFIILICLGLFFATQNQFIVSHLGDLIVLPNLLKAP